MILKKERGKLSVEADKKASSEQMTFELVWGTIVHPREKERDPYAGNAILFPKRKGVHTCV